MLYVQLVVAMIAAGGGKAPTLDNLHEVLGFQPDGNLVTRLFPIGFSKKGHFAYFLEPADEAVGCYLWELRIVDLVTDGVVERVSWDSGDGDCDPSAQNRASVMRKHGATFEKLLGKHGVKITAPAALETGAVVQEAMSYTAVLEPHPVVTSEDGSESQKLDVVIRSDKGRKSVGQVTAFSDGMPYTWGHRILGVLRSPAGSRIVVFVQEAYRGYEGPPNVTGVKLFGASLRVGFKNGR